ncbi:histidine phosphatase family protein [Sphingorhabdus arenilitoris]|uniref:Histidine phosphatase family protein n=1 Tax=Sphingorhabdus arenilitoris TaxID=1490041 RepID=A0ABV8RJR5_9SPHN
MRLILVRHGKPETNGAATLANPPLSDIGRQQADYTAQYLRHEGIDAVIHSGMDRARDTAAPLAKLLSAEMASLTALGEIDRYGGRYANVESIRAQGEHEWQNFLRDPLGYFDVDEQQFIQETLAGFASLFQNQRRKTLAIFTHGFPINILLTHALGLDGIANFVPDYCSITRLTGSALDKLTVVSINETAHLSDHLAKEKL